MLKCDADLFDLRALERDPHSAGSRHLGHEQLMILCYTGERIVLETEYEYKSICNELLLLHVHIY